MSEEDWDDIITHAEDINKEFEQKSPEELANNIISDNEFQVAVNREIAKEAEKFDISPEDVKKMEEVKEKVFIKLNRERRQKALMKAYMQNFEGDFYEKHRYYPDGDAKRRYRRKLERMSRKGLLKEVDLNS